MDLDDIIFTGVIGAVVALITAVFLVNRSRQVLPRLRRLLGKRIKTFPIVTAAFNRTDLPDLHLALEEAAKTANAFTLHGCLPPEAPLNHTLQSEFGIANTVKVGPVQYSQVEVGFEETLPCVENGLYLMETDEGRLAVRLYRGDALFLATGPTLEVMSDPPELAGQFIDTVRRHLRERSIYRGKVLIVDPTASIDSGFALRFSALETVGKDQIVLPEETSRLLERNTISYFKHAKVLRESGRSVRRGLLFHGPPGTGKTLTAKWLATALEEVTVFLLSAEQMGDMTDCFELARRLAPSLLILEDVDLIAIERDAPGAQRVQLHQLMNEMDGLAPDAEVMLLLTTNRPEVIEPALAARPGRVDQAVEFPLPDADCRRRLFDLYCRGLTLALDDQEQLIKKCKGASPAFIKELIRKAALSAAEKGASENGELRVTDEDFEEAQREMLLGGGKLTRSILGFRG